MDLESEALEDECCAGKGTKGMLSTDKVLSHGVRSDVLMKQSVLCARAGECICLQNKRVIHQFWTFWNTTGVSLNSSSITKRSMVILTIFEPFRVTAFMNQVKPKYSIESRAPCANAFNNTRLIVSQCLEPSVCLSSWS